MGLAWGGRAVRSCWSRGAAPTTWESRIGAGLRSVLSAVGTPWRRIQRGEMVSTASEIQRDPALRAGGEVAFSEGELLLLECTKACDGCCWRLRLLGVAVFRTQSYN